MLIISGLLVLACFWWAVGLMWEGIKEGRMTDVSDDKPRSGKGGM